MLFFPRCVEREHTNMQSYLRLRPQAQTSNDYLLKPARPLRNGERVPISPHPGWFPGTSRDFIKNHLLPKIISKQSLFKKKKTAVISYVLPTQSFSNILWCWTPSKHVSLSCWKHVSLSSDEDRSRDHKRKISSLQQQSDSERCLYRRTLFHASTFLNFKSPKFELGEKKKKGTENSHCQGQERSIVQK